MLCLSQMSPIAVKGKVNKQTKIEVIPTKLVCCMFAQSKINAKFERTGFFMEVFETLSL